MTTFVLLHGAFEGGWIWQRVARKLRAAGHDVFTPTLTGCGERAHLLHPDITLATHVDDVVNVFEMEDLHDVVLVGHSYGGTVVTVVADRVANRVQHLVYLDASAPDAGQASTGAFAEGTDDKLAEMASGDDAFLPPLPLAAVGITDDADIAWVEPRRRPHPVRTLHEPVVLSGATPSHAITYVEHTRNEEMVRLFGVNPLAPFVDKAKERGWGLARIDAGHDAMVTHAEEVAQVLTTLEST